MFRSWLLWISNALCLAECQIWDILGSNSISACRTSIAARREYALNTLLIGFSRFSHSFQYTSSLSSNWRWNEHHPSSPGICYRYATRSCSCLRRIWQGSWFDSFRAQVRILTLSEMRVLGYKWRNSETLLCPSPCSMKNHYHLATGGLASNTYT